jgi:hypothetical protein
MTQRLRVVILKPSKYLADGSVERFRWGFMPNSTVPYIRSMTPAMVGSCPVEVHAIDEYVRTDLRYLALLSRPPGFQTLLALVGVQSHQFHRALDLGAYARRNGCLAVIGGPHAMTCDTSSIRGSGISIAQAEAELVWPDILCDAAAGELQPVYGRERRWQQDLEAPTLIPPARGDLARYVVPMLGVYPARGCPFLCNFCSVTKIAGRRIRSQSVDTTMAGLRAAKAAGVRTIMFTSDNFNKYPQAETLLQALIDEKLGLDFFVQCDAQIARQAHLVDMLGRAGCFQMFVGVESFNRKTLLAAHKGQNRPETYRDIVRLCREHGFSSHFSNIIGFPQDTEQEVQEHLDALREMAPTWASFYILCPIPGTEQYDDFLSRGLITETNLDRFDTTCATWRHPYLGSKRLVQLLFECYRRFYSVGHILGNVRTELRFRLPAKLKRAVGNLGMSFFNRYCTLRAMHPMSGGIRRVRLDGVRDFISLRRSTFGFERVPLPTSLPLPAAENLVNQTPHPASRESRQSTQAKRPADSDLIASHEAPVH